MKAFLWTHNYRLFSSNNMFNLSYHLFPVRWTTIHTQIWSHIGVISKRLKFKKTNGNYQALFLFYKHFPLVIYMACIRDVIVLPDSVSIVLTHQVFVLTDSRPAIVWISGYSPYHTRGLKKDGTSKVLKQCVFVVRQCSIWIRLLCFWCPAGFVTNDVNRRRLSSTLVSVVNNYYPNVPSHLTRQRV